ncbi:MAG: glycosyltransferase family 2 protein, partial [Candidatus Nanohaloarchaea archaeon]
MGGVAVGICAHNEEETIGPLLDRIFAEDVDVTQVIVVAAGDDRTVDIVEEKQEEYGDIVLVEEEGRGGQSAAQNKIL